MKTLLFSCIKNENLYLREWVEFYKKYGFTNIIIYDNNDINGEYPHQVIGDYIANGYVLYEDKRGIENLQYKAMKDCYNTIAKNFDWIAFFDVDEFIEDNTYKNIDDLLKYWEKDGDPDCIMFPWKKMTDNGLIHYDGRGIIERFGNKGIEQRYVFKPMVKTNKNLIACDYRILGDINETVYCKIPYLRHYQCKTIEEFFLRKFGTFSYANDEVIFTEENLETNNEYFKEEFIKFGNEWNEEKEAIWNNLFNGFKKNYEHYFEKIKYKQPSKNIALTIVSNDKYMRLSKICIKSFLKYNKWFNGDIIIIYDDGTNCGLSEESKNIFKKIYNNTKFHIVNKDKYSNLIEHFKYHTPSKLCSSFYKLDAFDFEEYDTIIQIDGDLLFLNSIEDVLKYDYQFIACEDYPMFEGRSILKIPNNNKTRKDQSINCGFYVINKPSLAQGMTDKLIKYGETMDLSLITSYSPNLSKFVEQDLLSCYYYDKEMFLLSNEYNMPKSNFWNDYYLNLVPKCKVIHYFDDKPFDNRPELEGINKIWLNFEEKNG